MATVSITGVASPESSLPPQAAAKIARAAKATDSGFSFFCHSHNSSYTTKIAKATDRDITSYICMGDSPGKS